MTQQTQRKRYEWNVEQYTGHECGWEVVTTEDTFREARERRREYRENQPEYPVRIRLVRIRSQQ